MLTEALREECLDHLRAADAILMAENELAVAVHLSLVIELLEANGRLALKPPWPGRTRA